MPNPIYITTPIYYVTDKPHIGHLYTTVAADILARYHRFVGDDVRFLTGTDEHGQKIQKKAKENGETPQELADRVVERYRDVWKKYGITNDDFIRTTDEWHKKTVYAFMEKLLGTGDIYLGSYEGWYCVPDESYWTETQVVDGKCPECGRPVEWLKEESYFFKLSKYEKALVAHIEKNPDFIVPTSRKNEVLGFIKQGLRDISASRTTIEWGIPMPKDGVAQRDHKVYVWFDALTNYISALDYPPENPNFKKYWEHAVHLVGKDIIKFHAVYWPTFLMALGLPLPKQIVAHGWLTDSNRKISKSLGNAIDPLALADKVGVDGMRYFLFREFVFGADGEYTAQSMYTRINSDLANDYGNCISRTSSMILKYLGEGPFGFSAEVAGAAKISEGWAWNPATLPAQAERVIAGYHEQMNRYAFEKALESASQLLSSVNARIDAAAPWKLAKSEADADKRQLRLTLATCWEDLRLASILLRPFIPTSADKALEVLGVPTADERQLCESLAWGRGPASVTIQKCQPLFPRLEYKPEETA